MSLHLENVVLYLQPRFCRLLTAFGYKTPSLRITEKAVGHFFLYSGTVLEVGTQLAFVTQMAFIIVGISGFTSGINDYLDSALILAPVHFVGRLMKRSGKRLARLRTEELWPINSTSHVVADPAENTSQQASPPRRVLYLRPFENDERATSPICLTATGHQYLTDYSVEELIESAFKQIGPLVAVAKPSVERPELGVARAVLPPEDWQPPVCTLIHQAALVVILVGMTPNVFDLPPISRTPV